jgi:long-chain acyl-CoA synthetase
MVNTYADPLLRARRVFGPSEAIVDGDVRLTFDGLADRVERVGGLLAASGLRPGDRVAVLADNSHQYVELYLGAPSAGFVVVPLNHRLAMSELVATLEDCRPRLLFTDWAPDDVTPLAALVDRVVHLGVEFDEEVANSPAVALCRRSSEDALAILLYTGGTTGRSKGVMLSHRNKLCDALSVITSTSLTSDDRWLINAPMFHSSGLFNILPCAWVGACSVILPRFDPVQVLDTVERERITVAFGVPTMLAALTELQRTRRADLSSLRLLGHGAAPITSEQLRSVCDVLGGVEVMGMYGATEMAPMATTFSHQEREVGTNRLSSCGRPVLGVDVRVVDDNGAEVPTGSVGEIVVSGPNVMLGYWEQPEATADALSDGQYRSGDLGYLDGDGLLYVVDRKKDMIITGGENVYSTEVENVIAMFGGVSEVAVIGVPDAYWGEAVHAVVVSDQDLDPEAIRLHCRAFLAGYKVPKRVHVQARELPRSPAGKITKTTLRNLVQLGDAAP